MKDLEFMKMDTKAIPQNLERLDTKSLCYTLPFFKILAGVSSLSFLFLSLPLLALFVVSLFICFLGAILLFFSCFFFLLAYIFYGRCLLLLPFLAFFYLSSNSRSFFCHVVMEVETIFFSLVYKKQSIGGRDDHEILSIKSYSKIKRVNISDSADLVLFQLLNELNMHLINQEEIDQTPFFEASFVKY